MSFYETVHQHWDKPTSNVSASEFSNRSNSATWILVATALCVFVGITWSVYASVVEVAVGQGRVIPERKIQLVQNLEGGIIKQISVSEGQVISKGDILVEIDPTATGSVLKETKEHLAALTAQKTVLLALLEGRKPDFDKEFLHKNSELAKRSISHFEAENSRINASLKGLEKRKDRKSAELLSVRNRILNHDSQIENAMESLKMFRSLFSDEAASKADVLQAESRVLELRAAIDDLVNLQPSLKAEIDEIQSQSQETIARFRAQTTDRLNEVSVKLSALQQASIADHDRIARSKVKSPVNGVVKLLHTNTIGQIVKPGENIVEIVPLGETLVIETNIRPNDIAFIYPDQPASIKITAYDSSIFGNLSGIVKHISADSVVDDHGHSFYKVLVQAQQAHLEKNGKKFPIIPGMVAQVDIVTGEKTVFEYITKPIHRTASTAFRER